MNVFVSFVVSCVLSLVLFICAWNLARTIIFILVRNPLKLVAVGIMVHIVLINWNGYRII